MLCTLNVVSNFASESYIHKIYKILFNIFNKFVSIVKCDVQVSQLKMPHKAQILIS